MIAIVFDAVLRMPGQRLSHLTVSERLGFVHRGWLGAYGCYIVSSPWSGAGTR